MNCSIKEPNNLIREREKLINQKNKYINIIRAINTNLNKLEERICTICQNSNGHTWVTERSPGLYGDKFKYCKFCGFEA